MYCSAPNFQWLYYMMSGRTELVGLHRYDHSMASVYYLLEMLCHQKGARLDKIFPQVMVAYDDIVSISPLSWNSLVTTNTAELTWMVWLGSQHTWWISPIAIILASPRIGQIIVYSIFMTCHQLQGSLSYFHICKNNIIIYLLICINKSAFLLHFWYWTILNIDQCYHD